MDPVDVAAARAAGVVVVVMMVDQYKIKVSVNCHWMMVIAPIGVCSGFKIRVVVSSHILPTKDADDADDDDDDRNNSDEGENMEKAASLLLLLLLLVFVEAAVAVVDNDAFCC